MESPTAWLLQGPAYVAYRTRLDLLGEDRSDPAVQALRAQMLAHQQLTALVSELAAFPGEPLTSHKSAAHALYKLGLLADIGWGASDPGMDRVAMALRATRSPEGLYQINVLLPAHFGGSGQTEAGWMLCDAPLLLAAATQLGLAALEELEPGIAYLRTHIRANGWPCITSLERNFRGPGRRDDPCPLANLLMLKLLSLRPEWRDTPEAATGVNTALTLWEQRCERRPYLFGMGSDFAKLKAPTIWYDIVHVLDVLSRYPTATADPRLHAMADIVRAKADELGRYTPESVWLAWRGWEFGQKKEPSPWLTLLVTRALARLRRAA